MELVITWWMIPTAITVGGTVWVLFIFDDGGGMFSGIGNIMMMVPVLAVSLVAWVIAAFCK